MTQTGGSRAGAGTLRAFGVWLLVVTVGVFVVNLITADGVARREGVERSVTAETGESAAETVPEVPVETGAASGEARVGTSTQREAAGSVSASSSEGGDAPPWDASWLTVAETSGYQGTATHDEVVAWCDAFAAGESGVVRRGTFGLTEEGREIPMVIIADPPASSAAEAREAAKQGRLVVLAFGNIHAGEVCGKEALPMVAREIVRPWKGDAEGARAIREGMVLVVAPIYNADGNERFDEVEKNRPGQAGPRRVGVRANAKGLDLNRDYVKAEALETRAMLRFLREWSPHVVIDTHTTNGSFHRYTLTYESALHPSAYLGEGEVGPAELSREVMQRAGERIGEEWGTFWYGDFDGEKARWETYSAMARYGANSVGLRGMVSILTEAYTYAPFKDRVLCTGAFVRACLDELVARKDAVRSAREAWEARWMGGLREVAIRTRAAPFAERVRVRGWVETSDGEGRSRPTGTEKEYEVEHWGRFEGARVVTPAWGYAVPARLSSVVGLLRAQGVEVSRLARDVEVEIGELTVREVKRAERAFQGRVLQMVEVDEARETRTLAREEWVIVRSGQRLQALLTGLLEPESEDGLAAWGLLGELNGGNPYPVIRVLTPLQADIEVIVNDE